jgi:hypothetical protein
MQQQAEVFEVPRVGAVLRHALPNVLEGTLVPLALFNVAYWAAGVWAGLLAALVWSYSALVRRALRHERIPGVLVLGAAGLTARTLLALLTQNVVIYFLQPSLNAIAIAAAFLVSAVLGRPLVERLAGDFCPLPPELLSQAPVRRAFTHVTVLWALVQLLNAVVTIWLLMSQPMPTYLLAKTLLSWVLTGTAATASTIYVKTSLRRAGILAPAA